MFKDKVVVITGGAQGIGKCIAREFETQGAHCCIIDAKPGGHFVGDISKKEVLEEFSADVIKQYGRVDYLINNAAPLMKGIEECSYEEFQYALAVGVSAPFYLAKLFRDHFAKGASIINL
ncbi:MAG: SDR family oxidoreductase, partial [Clostridia bacterium]|nr:SDR family oxidoreductase [Clostridia bacterium]